MKTKTFLLCILGASVALTAQAVPARRGLRAITQPDGTTIHLRLIGDERSHCLVTEDGYAVKAGADGHYYYLTSTGLSAVRATDPGERNALQQKYVETLVADAPAMLERQAAARKAARAAAPARASQIPSSGSPKVPIVLVQYSDVKFSTSDPKATFEEFFNGTGKSARQYFVDQSNGKYTPQFDVLGPVTLANTRATYGANGYDGYDVGVGAMVAEGCKGLGSVDFSKYDNDGDGYADVVVVLYAGVGEASSGEEDSVWPMQWSLRGSDYGKTLKMGSTTVDKFAVFNEMHYYNTKIDGIGTFCHEYSHCLDLPDFYDTEGGNHFGMSEWSLLDYGCYNDDGYTPVGYSAYEKMFMDWIELEEAVEGTDYTLPVFNQKSAETDRAIVVYNDADADEYYILENRAQQGWDKYLPAQGLMITHVTYDENAWWYNTVNNYDLQRMTLIPADGVLLMDKITGQGYSYYDSNKTSLKGDLWPYGTANALTDSSFPAAKVNTGGYMGKPIVDITRNSDGTVSFSFMPSTTKVPETKGTTVTSTTSFQAQWEPVGDGDVVYTLEVAEKSGVSFSEIAKYDFSNDTQNWTMLGFGAIESGALRIGSNSTKAKIMSPAFVNPDTGGGVVTVHFTAKTYATDATKLTVSLYKNGVATDYAETFSINATYTTYEAVFKAVEGESYSVVIESQGSKKRAYITEASIYSGSPEWQAPARADAGERDYRLIENITGTSYTVENLKEKATYTWRVKALGADARESAWSEKTTVDLSTGPSSGCSDIQWEGSDGTKPAFDMLGRRTHATGKLRKEGSRGTIVVR